LRNGGLRCRGRLDSSAWLRARSAEVGRRTQKLSAKEYADDDHGSGTEAIRKDLVHGGRSPRRPPHGAALWDRVHLVQHRPRDAGDILVPVLVEPRSDCAADVTVGSLLIAHWAASRAIGSASAFSAERSCRVA